MQCIAVELGVHGHRSNPELAACAYHSHRDLAPVGDQHLRKHGRMSTVFVHESETRGWGASTMSRRHSHAAGALAIATSALLVGLVATRADEAEPAGQFAKYGGPITFPLGIAAGPDGALWFTNRNSGSPAQGNGSIGRVTTTGTVSYVEGHGISTPRGIAAGPDGAMWFTNTGS